MPQARVLVTGSQGFTGQYVADEFAAAGYDVWGTGLRADAAGLTKFLMCDFTDRSQVHSVIARAQPDVVIHLAGISFVAHDQPEDLYRINLIATQILLDALATQGFGQRGVLLPSSANVYGNSDTMPINEGTALAPTNEYAVSKVAMEMMARLRFEKLPIVIVRPFNYTGRTQNNKFLVPKVVAHFRKRKSKIQLGNLNVERDFSDVRDVGVIYRRLIEAQPWGQVVNMCSGVATSLNDVVSICQDITGHQIAVEVDPDFVREREIKTLLGDKTRLDHLIGGLPRRSIRETLEWMLTD